MAINKVEFDGQTLIDLTGDTVTQQDVLNGKSFHTPDGVQRSGTASIPVSDVTVDGTSVVTNGVAEVVSDNLAPTVTEASSRTNLAVGDSLKTIISKIKKFFSDLKTVAFTGSYNDLSDKPTIPDISTKVSKSGDTMTGLLKFSTYGFRTYQDWGYDIGDSGNFHHLRNSQWDNWQIKKYDTTEALTYTFERGELTNYGDVIINHKDGTASAAGTTVLSLGNNIAEGTDKNSKGLLRIYSNTAKKTDITAPSLTDDRTLSLPNKSGTIALTSEIPDVSGKVNKSGDTMSGVLNSSYKSASWKNSWTNSAVSLSDSEGSFGGWICGPTKNGRIAIQSYQANDDKLYIGYASRGRTTNSNERQVCWNGATGKWECDITGNCDGTANKANKDGSGNTITSTYLKKGGDTITGNLNIGSGGGYLNASATNGGCNSILIGDDVWLGDVNQGGIMGMKSTGSNCGFSFYNSSGTHIGTLQSTGGTLQFNGNTIMTVAGGTFTGNISIRKSNPAFSINDGTNICEFYSNTNGTLCVKSRNGWLNLMTPQQVQCRNAGDTAWVNIQAANVSSSRRFKENIKDLTEEEAKKLLDVRTVTFDFKESYAPSSDWEHERFNQSGVIAEEVLDIYPTLVRFSNYEEPEKDPIPTFVEYSHFVPYLIKMVQMQQKEIDQLKAEVAELKR